MFNQDISVIRNYPGGSNATTILCMDSTTTFYRKYALGNDANKLWQQIQWIEENRERIPLPAIIRKERTDTYCFYDMPYISHSVGLFEYAHSAKTDQTWSIVRSLLDKMCEGLYKESMAADQKSLHRYYVEKVQKNCDRIHRSKLLKEVLAHDMLVINDREYPNFSYYMSCLDEDCLKDIFANDRLSIVHGDLTFENIVCTRDDHGKDGFYIIDPNTGNLHDSPNLDYAKVLQSLHGEYELIKAAKEINVSGNRIDFKYTSSSVYAELYEKYKEYLKETFDNNTIRSIFFHEIVHWLRLVPYKLSHSDPEAWVFFATMILVMDDVVKMFGTGRKSET